MNIGDMHQYCEDKAFEDAARGGPYAPPIRGDFDPDAAHIYASSYFHSLARHADVTILDDAVSMRLDRRQKTKGS